MERKYEVILWTDDKQWLVENTHPYDKNHQYIPIGKVEDIIDLQDKLHRRNMQIKELKKEISKLKEGNSVVESIISGHPATVFECVHNTFIEHYPKTAAEHQAISHYCHQIDKLLI